MSSWISGLKCRLCSRPNTTASAMAASWLANRLRRLNIGCVYTAYALVRNLMRAPGESNAETAELRFPDFRFWNVPQCEVPYDNRMTGAREIFAGSNICFGDWVYEKHYSSPPPAPGPSPSGFGGIPEDTEDSLLLLRLFKSGDISFAQVVVRDPKGKFYRQYPYRVISDILQCAPLSAEPKRVPEVGWVRS